MPSSCPITAINLLTLIEFTNRKSCLKIKQLSSL
nr:MAG TPA: hypothetical protein [Caudoviricetes sp.]